MDSKISQQKKKYRATREGSNSSYPHLGPPSLTTFFSAKTFCKKKYGLLVEKKFLQASKFFHVAKTFWPAKICPYKKSASIP